MKCPLCSRDISAGSLDCGSHRSTPLSTQPDSLVAALQLAQQQLNDRTQSLADAKQTISLLVDALTSLAAVLNDTSVKLASAIQNAGKVKALLGS